MKKYGFSITLTNSDYGFCLKTAVVLDNARVENDEYLMAVGADSSLDVALKIATKGLLQWVQQEYHLTDAEATQVLGSPLEYKIAEIVDPKSGNSGYDKEKCVE